MKLTIIPLQDLLAEDRDYVTQSLANFFCVVNKDVEYFLRNSAIEFENRDLARTLNQQILFSLSCCLLLFISRGEGSVPLKPRDTKGDMIIFSIRLKELMDIVGAVRGRKRVDKTTMEQKNLLNSLSYTRHSRDFFALKVIKSGKTFFRKHHFLALFIFTLFSSRRLFTIYIFGNKQLEF